MTVFDLMVYFGGFCLLIGVGYPLAAAVIYPFYRALGGRQRFRAYMKSL